MRRRQPSLIPSESQHVATLLSYVYRAFAWIIKMPFPALSEKERHEPKAYVRTQSCYVHSSQMVQKAGLNGGALFMYQAKSPDPLLADGETEAHSGCLAEPGQPRFSTRSPPGHTVLKSRSVVRLVSVSWPPPSPQLGSFVLQTNSCLEVIHQNKSSRVQFLFLRGKKK